MKCIEFAFQWILSISGFWLMVLLLKFFALHPPCKQLANTVLLPSPQSAICVITISTHTGRGWRCNISTCLWVALHQQRRKSPACTHRWQWGLTSITTHIHVQNTKQFCTCSTFIAACSNIYPHICLQEECWWSVLYGSSLKSIKHSIRPLAIP